jgi:prolipoprotein diacylglyceryltransferase
MLRIPHCSDSRLTDDGKIVSRNGAGSRPDEANDFFLIYLILLAVLGPRVSSVFNRNEYQKQKNNISGE